MTNDITQADRELLAAEYEKLGSARFAAALRDNSVWINASDTAALRAIAAARVQAQGGGEVVAWAEKYGDEWAVYDANSDIGQHIRDHQKYSHFKSVFPVYDRPAPPSAPVGVKSEPGAVRLLVAAANAVLALYPGDDQLWTLESAVRPFNATKPAECAGGCPPQQVCDYCQIASLAQQPAQSTPVEVERLVAAWEADIAAAGPLNKKDLSPARFVRDLRALAQSAASAPVGVIGDAIRHLSKWLDANDCECESGHQCGRTEVERTRDQLRALAKQPSVAPVGVEAKLLARDVHYAIRDAGLAPSSPTRDAEMRDAILTVIAQQPAADEEAAEQYRKGWEAGHAAAQQPAAVDVFDLDCPHSAIGGCDLCATQPGGGAS